MSRSPSKASKAAYKRCSETCQRVRAEIHEAIENVVVASLGENHSCEFLAELTDAAFDAALAHGTEPIRDALIDCEEELIEAQEALATAEDDRDSYIREAASWESKSYDLEADVRALESELDTARSEVQSSRL